MLNSCQATGVASRVVTQRASGHGLFCWETFRLVCSLFCPCDAVRAAAPPVPCLGQLCRDPFRPLCSRACPCDPASLLFFWNVLSLTWLSLVPALLLAAVVSCSCPADGLGLKLGIPLALGSLKTRVLPPSGLFPSFLKLAS